jgi:hypothetical protein
MISPEGIPLRGFCFCPGPSSAGALAGPWLCGRGGSDCYGTLSRSRPGRIGAGFGPGHLRTYDCRDGAGATDPIFASKEHLA